MRFVVFSLAEAGRPRDPQMEERVFRAALDLYGEAGWAGPNLTRIVAETGVGKSSLYSRWSGRDEPLRHAFTALIVHPRSRRDPPWEIFVNRTDFRLREYLDPNRSVVHRLFVEAGNAEGPVVCQTHKDLFVIPLSAIHERSWGLRLNGELSHNASVVRLFDAIGGSVLMCTFCLLGDVIVCFLEKVSAYMVDPVDDQLRRHGSSHQLDE